MPATLRGQRRKPAAWPVSPLNVDPQFRNLWRGLVFAVAPGEGWQTELVSRTMGDVVGSGDFASQNELGSAGVAGADSDGFRYLSNPGIRAVTKNYTVVWIGEIHARGAGSSFAHLLSVPYRTTGWTAPFFAVRLVTRYTDDALQFHHQESGTFEATVTLAKSDAGFLDFVDDGQAHMGAATRDGATVVFYKDGLQFGASKTLTNNTDPDFSGGTPDIGISTRSPYSAGEGARGNHSLGLFFDRTLAPAEIAQIWRDPFGFIRPRRIIAAAGTTHQLAATPAVAATVAATLSLTVRLGASLPGAAAVSADLSVSVTHLLAAVLSAAATVAPNLTIPAPAAVAAAAPPALARVSLYDGAFRKFGELVTATDVNRSYVLNDLGVAEFDIAIDDPLIAETSPLLGRVIVIQSAVYPYAWVGKITRRSGTRRSGKVRLQSASYGRILGERFLPADYTTSLSAGEEMLNVLATVNRRNPTGIEPGAVRNHGSLVAGLALPEWDALRALDSLGRSGGLEHWLEAEVSAQDIEILLRIAPARGFNRYRDFALVDGANFMEGDWLEEGEAVAFSQTVIAGQVTVTQGFSERTRVTVVRQEGGGFRTALVPVGSSVDSTVSSGDGRNTKDSAISFPHGFAPFQEVIVSSPITTREVTVVREELKTQDITAQTARALLARQDLAERVLRGSAITTSDWQEIAPGDVVRLVAPDAFVGGFNGPARILATNPREDEGTMPLVLQLLRERDEETGEAVA